MAKFRKKPVEIEAYQWFKNGDHPLDNVAPDDMGIEGALVRRFRRPDYPGTDTHVPCGHIWHDHGWIDTLEGGHTVCPGDWIITGIAGESYPCKPLIFEKTYFESPEMTVDDALVVTITDISIESGICKPDDYVLVAGPNVDINTNVYATGTHQITVKKVKP